ncbi:MAG: Rid family hydrolase [Gammaproteobacteria bacterium]|nr:Rid family hydrolase [Gammaproteobacteria bacterium]
MKRLIPGLAILLAGCTTAGTSTTEPFSERIIPERWQQTYEEWAYAPAVRTGNRLVLSGVPAAGPGGVEKQVERAYAVIDGLLNEAGFDRSHIIELTTFHVVSNTEELTANLMEYEKAHKRYFEGHAYPAWSAVGVTALLSPGATVEIRVVAERPPQQ